MQLLEQIAACDEFRMDYDLQPGDMQFINNHTILHARGAFEDWEDEKDGGKRHLLRTWISPPNGRLVNTLLLLYDDAKAWCLSLLQVLDSMDQFDLAKALLVRVHLVLLSKTCNCPVLATAFLWIYFSQPCQNWNFYVHLWCDCMSVEWSQLAYTQSWQNSTTIVYTPVESLHLLRLSMFHLHCSKFYRLVALPCELLCTN